MQVYKNAFIIFISQIVAYIAILEKMMIRSLCFIPTCTGMLNLKHFLKASTFVYGLKFVLYNQYKSINLH